MKGILSAFAAALVFSANACLPQPPASGPTQAKSGTSAPPAAVRDALTLESQGKSAEAEAAWKLVVKAQPHNAQAFAHLGLMQAHQQHYQDAINNYRKAQTLSPTLPQLDFNLGLAFFKSGSFRDAEKAFKGELKAHPSEAAEKQLTTLIGMAYYGAHDYPGAIPWLKESAAQDQHNLELLLALAHCYLWTKQFDATMMVYKEILEVDPDSAEADMIAGEALDEKGDNAGAVQQFRAAEKANPNEPNVHFGLAYLLWAQKRYDEAIPEFQAELQNDPKNYQAMIYLGDTYTQINDFDHAKRVLEESASHEDAMPLIHLDLGIVYQETGDAVAALRELKRTVVLEPDNVNAHFRLAKIYRSTGNQQQAKVEFAKASSLNKKTDDAQYNRIAEANARPAPPSKLDKIEEQPRQDPQEKPKQ